MVAADAALARRARMGEAIRHAAVIEPSRDECSLIQGPEHGASIIGWTRRNASEIRFPLTLCYHILR
jgi:hypothetical protein